jgi:hypothetical protein
MSVLHFVENDAFLEDKLMNFVVSFHEKVFIERCVYAEFGIFSKVLKLHDKFVQRVFLSGLPLDMAFTVDFVFVFV